ncbi:MAG: hypothetical protein WCJ33_00020 [Pseudomonadota bacterium]
MIKLNKNYLPYVCVSLLAISSVVSPIKSSAQIIVSDPGNLAQNVLTAIRTLQSNVNEAQQIANQLQNLQQLNYTSTSAYTSSYSGFLTKIQGIQGQLGNVTNLEQAFQAQYPTFSTTPAYNGKSMISQLTNWQSSLSSSMASAVGTNGAVINSIPATQANMNNLLSASNNSQGALQATQAGNQMVATVSGQLSQMSGQLATYQDAHLQYLAQQQSQQATMGAASDYIYSDYTKVGARNPLPMPGTER